MPEILRQITKVDARNFVFEFLAYRINHLLVLCLVTFIHIVIQCTMVPFGSVGAPQSRAGSFGSQLHDQ